MEGGKQTGSSFTSDLFGSKDSTPGSGSSSGIFGSLFPPPAKVMESLHFSENEKKRGVGTECWNGNTGVYGTERERGKETSPYYQEEKVQPFHYSSSIYYGGQDVYPRPKSAQSTISNTFNKDGGEHESERGNWWQGSLYY